MRAVPQRQNVFYGWIVVATALIIIAVGLELMFSLGVFMGPLESVLGVWLGGRVFDTTGAYQFMYLLSFGMAMAGVFLAVWLRPPRASRAVFAVQHTS
jgi:hypothetical protein